jgi:putative ATP-dependent endonuclease of OLD family
LDGYAWVSAGREIENYIPSTVLQSYLHLGAAPQLNQYSEFDVVLEGLKAGEGKRYLVNKVRFASQICPLLTKDSLSGWLDLAGQLDQVTSRILKWNGMAGQ